MSPEEGWGRVEQEATDRRARQEQWEAQQYPKVFLPKDGTPVIMRFVQDAPLQLYVHSIRVGTGKNDFRMVPCLNDAEDGTACPGCEGELKRSLRCYFNAIQRERPIFRKDANGRAQKDQNGQFIVDGHEDTIVVYECSQTTGELLRTKANKYKGLTSRDWELIRTADNFNPVAVEPADPDGGPKPITAADQTMVNKGLVDLKKVTEPPSYADFARTMSGYRQGGDSSSGGDESTLSDSNVFAARKR